MADPPADTSNGTCYAAPGHRLDDRFLPCGNAALGPQTCCWQGDTCLVDGACFGVHSGSYVTYLAGCTDKWYGGDEQISSSTCPPKGEAALAAADAWVGLAYCNGSSNQWQACRQPGHPTTLMAAGPCACPSDEADRTVGVAAGPALDATASLPLSAGGSISWVSPYGPGGGRQQPASSTSSSSLSSSALTESTVSVTSSIETADSTFPAPSGSSTSSAVSSTSTTSTISTSAPPRARFLIIGTCVGIGGSLLALAVVAAVIAFHHRRRRRLARRPSALGAGAAGAGTVSSPNSNNNNNEDKPPCPADNPHTSALSPTTVSELEPRPARPWSLRSELEDSSCRSPVRSSAGTLAAMLTGNTVGTASIAATVSTATTTMAARESSTSATGMAEITPTRATWQELAELE